MRLSRWTHRASPSSASAWIETVPRASVYLIALVVFVRYLFVGHNDPQRCNALLASGSWPPSNAQDGDRREFGRWEPAGCRMYPYGWEEMRWCLGDSGRRVVFVGDSTLRQVFWSAAQRIDSVRVEEERMQMFVSENPQRDIDLDLGGVRIVFIWDPWLNSSGLTTELARFRPDPPAPDDRSDDRSATLLVLGAPGLWAARNGGDDYFELFRRGVDLVRPYLRDSLEQPAVEFPRTRNVAVLAPVQVPRYRKLPPARAETLTPARIRQMNDYLAGLPEPERSHVLWVYNEMTVRVRGVFEDTGLHVREAVADRRIDLLMNLRCNAGLGENPARAVRATCCAPSRPPVRGQILLLFTGLAVLPLLLWGRGTSMRRLLRLFPRARHLRAALALFAVLFYCYFADRTQFFARAEKRLSALSVSSLLVVTSVLSFLSVHRNTGRYNGGDRLAWTAGWLAGKSAEAPSTPRPSSKHGNDGPQDPGFIPREQSDEWKGWMQFLLLVFHFHDTSGLLWTHKLARLFAAGYLFLSAYGHASYFLRTEDYSLRRVAIVVWRLNFLPFVLSLMMRTDGTLYYFPRLATFWFLVVYVAMRLRARRLNGSPALLMLKLALTAVVTAVLAAWPAPFERLGWLVGLLGPVAYDAMGVRSQVALDRFAPYLGAMAAVLAHRVAVLKSEYRRNSTTLSAAVGSAAALAAATGAPASQPHRPRLYRRSSRRALPASTDVVDRVLVALLYPDQFSAPVWPILLVFSAVGLLVFFFDTQALHRYVDRESYDAYHPFISLVPIAAFALLRNCVPLLRRHHLALPAFLGPFTLEAYVLRNHAWLAADGGALLRLGVWPRRDDGGRWEVPSLAAAGAASPAPSWLSLLGWRLETLVISVAFLSLCWQAKRASALLEDWVFAASSSARHRDQHGDSDDEDLENAAGEPGVLSGQFSPKGGHRPRHSSMSMSSGGANSGLQDPRIKVAVILLVAYLNNVFYK